MNEHDLNTSDGIIQLSDRELDAVSGGDEVARLPQSIHMDYSRLGINENPTRYA